MATGDPKIVNPELPSASATLDELHAHLRNLLHSAGAYQNSTHAEQSRLAVRVTTDLLTTGHVRAAIDAANRSSSTLQKWMTVLTATYVVATIALVGITWLKP